MAAPDKRWKGPKRRTTGNGASRDSFLSSSYLTSNRRGAPGTATNLAPHDRHRDPSGASREAELIANYCQYSQFGAARAGRKPSGMKHALSSAILGIQAAGGSCLVATLCLSCSGWPADPASGRWRRLQFAHRPSVKSGARSPGAHPRGGFRIYLNHRRYRAPFISKTSCQAITSSRSNARASWPRR